MQIFRMPPMLFKPFVANRLQYGIWLCTWAFVLFLLAGPARAGAKVAVLYPQVQAPYFAVFQSIVNGIQSEPGLSCSLYPLAKDFDQPSLNRWLRSNQPEGIIALGKRGYQASKGMDIDLSTIVGALRITPNGMSGISLAADPDHLFKNLKALAPEVKRVFVVYSPKINSWQVSLAETAARQQGLSFSAFAANDLREAMFRYKDILKQVRSGQDAIWLPLDNVTANDDVALPTLLQEAWEKDLVLFSSKPSHVQRGALFSMYPDNHALGQRLAEMIASLSRGEAEPGVVPLSDLQIAVNLRTAAHLGLRFSPRQQQGFNLTFPSR